MFTNDSSETDESDLRRDGSDTLESLCHAFTIKVEHYRSLVYCVKWKEPMHSKSKSKRANTLKSRKDTCNEAASMQCQTRSKRRQKKAQSCNLKVTSENLSPYDIIDCIDKSHESDREDQDALVEIPDEGVDHSDDGQFSPTSSVVSGPSFPEKISANKSSSLCPACRELNQRAKRVKAPLKDKLLDTNPKSLTCDQWILLKPWSRKIMPDNRGNLSQLIHKLHLVRKGSKKTELLVDEVCSRPHLFLLRNLRCCIRKPLKKEKKKNWRKRAREDSEDPRVAKQQRLLNSHHQPISNGFSLDSSIQPVSNSLTFSSTDPMSSFLENRQNFDVTLKPSTVCVTSETANVKLQRKQNGPKRGTGFKDLLAQLRGNNSMIIRESSA